MLRRLLLWIILIAGLWIAVSRFTEIDHLLATLANGRWPWVLAALGLQVCYYVSYAWVYQEAFHLVGVEARLRDVLPVLLASIFVNVAAPTGGTAGNVLFSDDAAQRGQSPTRAAVGTVLALIADYGILALILLAGLLYLFVSHTLQTYQVVAAVLLWLLVAGLSGVLLLGLRQPAHLGRLLAWLQRTINRFSGWSLGRPLLPEGWAATSMEEVALAAAGIRAQPRKMVHLLAIALLAHLLDIASLYALFWAFMGPIALGTLVAGYSMGLLFWIVSITPQGIGIVEGVMALVYTSLGVSPAVATVVALAFRGLSFWLPFALGFWALRRLRSFRPERQVQTDVYTVRLAALAVGAIGLINLISAVLPALPTRFQLLVEYLPLEALRGARLGSAFLGFVLLILATHLWRRKRLAWLLALGLLVLSALGHLLKGLDYEEASLALLGAIWLWSIRHHFHARSDPPSVWHGLRILMGSVLFTLLYGALGFYLLDRHYRIHYDLWAALRQTVIMFTQFTDPGLQPITGFGRYFARSIYLMAAGTLSYALLALLRPVVVRRPPPPAERERAAHIVEQYGRSALARLTLLPDKSYYFTPGGSVIAYVVKGRGALALGDPIGPPEDADAAIVAYRDYCTGNDWVPAFFQVLPDYLDLYRKAGLAVLCIGHEAIVDLSQFTLRGKANTNLRNAVNRMTRLGYHAEMHPPPLSASLLRELRQVSDAWLTMVHGGEKTFLHGVVRRGVCAKLSGHGRPRPRWGDHRVCLGDDRIPGQ
ncbi:MAG: hypothetical protein KatS3mg050_2431 [Litorilinea sp.]|nr:MAG: hypothetical protein KatS3mg050_2431 [Litorilinea sp.]